MPTEAEIEALACLPTYPEEFEIQDPEVDRFLPPLNSFVIFTDRPFTADPEVLRDFRLGPDHKFPFDVKIGILVESSLGLVYEHLYYWTKGETEMLGPKDQENYRKYYPCEASSMLWLRFKCA